MLTLIRRPKGNRISDTVNQTYDIGSDGYGNALLSGGSGLSNGQVVQIRNTYTSYNGFWLLSGYGSGFKLYNYSGGDLMPYRQDVEGVSIYPSVGEIKQSCVHLPIQYQLESSKFPTNSFDTTRFVNAFYNDNGFIKITLSGEITNCEALDYLFISGTSVDDLDGAFQILTKHSTTQFTIAAPYSLASGSVYTYASATAVKYYNNYNVKIRVYGGLPTGHEWQELKPYELIIEESVKPDSSGVIKYNVAEKLKEKIEIQFNRPNFDSMPYDLDRFCLFYIEYAESYDSSNGLTVSNFTDSYTSDRLNFEGIAIDAKNEFKDRYSGYLSDFVYCDEDHPAKFLTDAVQPVLFNGWPFDLSIINNYGVATFLLVEDAYNSSDVLLGTYLTENNDKQNEGVLRLPISDRGGSYQNCYLANSIVVLPATSWNDGPGGFGFVTFTKGVNTLSRSSTASEVIVAEQIIEDIDLNNFNPVTITITVTGIWSAIGAFVALYIFDKSGTNGRLEQVLISSNGITQLTVTSASSNPGASTFSNLTVRADVAGYASGTMNISIQIEPEYLIAKGETVYSEVKRVDINSQCYSEYIYLEWKNKRSGFDKWLFTGFKDVNVNIIGTQEKDRNIYLDWDKSYNESADTITEETSRTSRQEFVVRSQNVTEDQINYIAGIKTSALVEQVTSIYDRRRVIVDRSSFTIKQEGDKLYNISFTIKYTNNIASQSL